GGSSPISLSAPWRECLPTKEIASDERVGGAAGVACSVVHAWERHSACSVRERDGPGRPVRVGEIALELDRFTLEALKRVGQLRGRKHTREPRDGASFGVRSWQPVEIGFSAPRESTGCRGV